MKIDSSKAITRKTEFALQIKNLRKSYGNTNALCGIDLSVRHGEVLGILGPNGAGKTTLLEILEGLLAFDSGEVSVLGIDMARQPEAVRGHISVTMQGHALPPAVKVSELIELYLAIYRSTEACAQVLALVGLEDKASSRIGRLSGGQKQRLALTLAIVGKAEVMFLDEPTSELDPQGRRLVWQALQQSVRQTQCSLIITTHQMEEAATLCDRVVIIDQGKIIASGSPSELIQTHCPGLSLIFKCSAMPEIEPIQAQFPSLSVEQLRDGVYLRLACEDFTQAMQHASVIRLLVEAQLREMTVEAKTLEDVFLKLTGRILRD